MIVIFLGKPGSGKGTQAELVSEKLEIPVISMGEILRNIKRQKTETAKKVSKLIDKGQFVPDNLIFGILDKRLRRKECNKGYILDGFPRTLYQAKMFKQKVDSVIYIDVSNSTIIKRLSSRRECSCGKVYNLLTKKPKKQGVCDDCGKNLYIREDDKPETVKKRLQIYNMQTKPLIEFYKKKGILHKVNGEQTIKRILSDIMKLLKKAA